jgi:hypothetical protein
MNEKPRDSGLVEFDPFRTVPFLRRLESASPSKLTIKIAIVSFVAVIVSSFLEKTLGHPSDFEPIQDILRAFNPSSAPTSHPSFPLLRDFPSMALIVIISATGGLIVKQWKAMKQAIPKLVDNGVLRMRHATQGSTARYGIPLPYAIRRKESDGQSLPLERLMMWFNRRLFSNLVAKKHYVIVGAAVAITLALILGQKREGITAALLPPGLSKSEQVEWLDITYNSWWASSEHFFGIGVYFCIVSFGLYLMLLQNVVGVAAVYLALCINAVAQFRLEGSVAENRRALRPIAAVYSTVLVTTALHGVALGMFYMVLNREFEWIIALVVLWTFLAPAYVLIPVQLYGWIRGDADFSQSRRDERAPDANQKWWENIFSRGRAPGTPWQALPEGINVLTLRRGQFSLGLLGALLPATLLVLNAFVDFGR